MTDDAVSPPARQPLSATQAREAVTEAILRIVPDADLDSIGPDESLRSELELDSLDFLSFVELLSERTGVRIDEADYPRLATMAKCTEFLGSDSRD
ncbi:acyl carrier protein [Nocardioides pacificus]